MIRRPQRSGLKVLLVLLLLGAAGCDETIDGDPAGAPEFALTADTSPAGVSQLVVRAEVLERGLAEGPEVELPRAFEVEPSRLEAVGVLTPHLVAAGVVPGTWIIGQGHAPHLVQFSATDEPPISAGQGGDGPGEFRDLAWVGTVGDRVVTFDARKATIAVFNADLELQEESRIQEEGMAQLGVSSSVFVGGRFEDGLVVGMPFADRPPPGEGLNTTTGRLVRLGLDGSLEAFGSGDPMVVEEWGGVTSPRGGLALDRNPPFGWTFEAATVGSTFFRVGDDGLLVGYDSGGEVVQRIDLGIPLREPTPEDFREETVARLEASGVVDRAALEENLRQMARTGLIMPVDHLLGADGKLWAFPNRHLAPTTASGLRPVIAVDLEDSAVGVAWVSDAFEPKGASRAGLWGLEPDSLDQEHLVVYDPSGLRWLE